MTPRTTVLTVFAVALSRMEQRIVDAALRLSREQHRTLSFRHYEEGSSTIPDLVVVTRHDGDLLEPSLAELPRIELHGGLATVTYPSTRQLVTPFGILECLDRAAEQVCATGIRATRTQPPSLLPTMQRLRTSAAAVAKSRESMQADILGCLRIGEFLI